MNTIDITRFTPIPSEEGYMIDKNGFVLSLKKKTPKVLIPQYDSRTGYYKVRINDRTRSIHSMVAETFIGERPDGYDIDHKDGNKLNNSVENLHYVSRKENQTNPNNKGMVSYQKLANRKVIAIKDGVETEFANCAEMVNQLGLYASGVSRCLTGSLRPSIKNGKLYSQKSCKGYTFRWAS